MASEIIPKPCEKCADKGLIHVAYESGEPFDLAVCDCRQGLAIRQLFSEDDIRRMYPELSLQNSIAWLEDFSDDNESSSDDFIAAASTQKRAKL